MLKRLILCLCLVCVPGAWMAAEGGERPLGEAIRAAAAAVQKSVVDVEGQGPQANIIQGAPGHPFVIPGPGAEGRREWRFEFRWPPGMDVPEGMEGQLRQMPFLRHRGGQVLGGRRRAAGFIVAVEGNRGLIAAPQQAVGGAKEAKVRLPDGREVQAKVLGTDRVTGLACLEIHADNLIAVKPAKAEAVRVGDWVLAIGGPSSGGAITVGIVSAKDRPGQGQLAGARVLLTDAFVPEGSSGGPVVNLKGEAIGMSLPAGRGATFGRGRRQLTPVLPIATLRDALDALARGGKVARGWLGVALDAAPPEGGRGVRVARAMPGQPAANAGIQNGDVILELDGEKVNGLDGLRALVAARKPGQKVAVRILRANEEIILEVALGEQPDQDVAGLPGVPRLAPAPRPKPPKAPAALVGGEKLLPGLTVQALTPELAAAFGFGGDEGLVVTGVDANSPAAKARPTPIQRGDLIKEIDRKQVQSLADAKAAIAAARKAKAKTLILLVRNKDGARYMVLDLPR